MNAAFDGADIIVFHKKLSVTYEPPKRQKAVKHKTYYIYTIYIYSGSGPKEVYQETNLLVSLLQHCL